MVFPLHLALCRCPSFYPQFLGRRPCDWYPCSTCYPFFGTVCLEAPTVNVGGVLGGILLVAGLLVLSLRLPRLGIGKMRDRRWDARDISLGGVGGGVVSFLGRRLDILPNFGRGYPFLAVSTLVDHSFDLCLGLFTVGFNVPLRRMPFFFAPLDRLASRQRL